MGRVDNFDDQTEGQMSLWDLWEPQEKLFAVSRIFARARKQMTLAEQKTLVLALTEIKFTEQPTTNIVYLDKKYLANIIGMKTDEDHLSFDLYNKIKELPKHSYIELAKEDIGLYDSGTVITRVKMLKNRVRIKFEYEFLPLFTGLSKDYITMWSGDIFKMRSIRSVQFYEYLRQRTDTRIDVNYEGFSVKTLKDMFNIPVDGDGSYMRKDGHFDRPAFEKKVIQPLCEDMQRCRMINLVIQPDGKMYEKVKQGSRVMGYRFYWTFSSHPAVATAAEVKQIQDRVDKNPEVLKVAKDILTGESKTGKKPKKGSFNDFEQRDYDYADMARKLAQMD